ncbi:hypothetical protein M5K25_011463 [Dendrobium thyrsiflorum]|uniref:Uncharacterized protein n=1 Tax=Dendrobium thyrsiflorum TaxID=117978 RepID=A0ABD0V9W9_DENTH
MIEKWGKLNDLPAPLHIGEEDIMRILKVPNIEHLLYEVRYLGIYIEEEFLFKVGLSIHAGRSEAKMLKKSSKVPELPDPAPAPVPKVTPKRQDVLNHQCIGRRHADDLLLRRKYLETELTHSLNKWNAEFVKIKYLQGEYKRKYDSRTKEAKNQQIYQLQVGLEGAQVVISQLWKDQKTSAEKVCKLEAENKRSHTLLDEKEATLSDLESSRIIEDFKKSIAFKSIIQDHVQEARDHIYDVEVKALELQCIDEGLTPSQASDDSSSDPDGDEVQSELQKVFALEVDDEIVDIE